MTRQSLAALRLSRVTLLQRFASISFVAIVLIGLAGGYLLGRAIERNALDAAAENARDTLNVQLLRHVTKQDVTDARYRWAKVAKFERFLRGSVYGGRTVRVKVWNRNGRVVYSDDHSIIGRSFPPSDELEDALGGRTAEEVSNLTSRENTDDRRLGSKLLEVYIPIVWQGRVYGAFEIYQRYGPVQRQIDGMRMTVYELLAGGLALLYVLLFGVVRNGSRTIVDQQGRLRRYTVDLETSYNDTIASLAAAVDARDHTTERHAQRVTELAVALACHLGLSEDELQDIGRGALLHDVGKIGISDSILLKAGGLTDDEWAEMRQHPEIGYRMLRNVAFLEDALPIVLYHHERWDGAGYPNGLGGEEIPLSARLFAVVDAYDALTSDRPYRRSVPHSVAMERLRQESGRDFDPKMLAAFDAMMQEQARQRESMARSVAS